MVFYDIRRGSLAYIVIPRCIYRGQRNLTSTTKNILFIDDEKDVTLTIKIILEETGLFHVDIFNDPDLVLKKI